IYIAVLPGLDQLERLLPQREHGVGAPGQRGVCVGILAGCLPAVLLRADLRADAAMLLPLFGAELIDQLLQGVERGTLFVARLLLFLFPGQLLVTLVEACLAALQGSCRALLL